MCTIVSGKIASALSEENNITYIPSVSILQNKINQLSVLVEIIFKTKAFHTFFVLCLFTSHATGINCTFLET